MVNFCLLTGSALGQYIYDVYRTGTQENMTARMYQSLVSQDFLFSQTLSSLGQGSPTPGPGWTQLGTQVAQQECEQQVACEAPSVFTTTPHRCYSPVPRLLSDQGQH